MVDCRAQRAQRAWWVLVGGCRLRTVERLCRVRGVLWLWALLRCGQPRALGKGAGRVEAGEGLVCKLREPARPGLRLQRLLHCACPGYDDMFVALAGRPTSLAAVPETTSAIHSLRAYASDMLQKCSRLPPRLRSAARSGLRVQAADQPLPASHVLHELVPRDIDRMPGRTARPCVQPQDPLERLTERQT